MKIRVISIILIFCLTACAKDSGVKTPIKSEFSPEVVNYDGSVFSAIVGSESTRNAGRIGSSLVLQTTDEPIEISFGQTGRDRNFGLTIYYDYKPIQFKVGGQEEYSEKFEFALKDSEEISFVVFVSENDIAKDNLSHFLTFIFTPSPEEYAKDKQKLTYNSAQIYNYNLCFECYDAEKECTTGEYNIQSAEEYYPYESTPLILNTEMFEVSENVYLPEKSYEVIAGEQFKINYIVSNLGGNSQSAVLFLEIGNTHTDINGQEYVYLELNNELMATGELAFVTPDRPGLYDVIGFVVYDPFSNINENPNQVPKTSVRFTLEVVEDR